MILRVLFLDGETVDIMVVDGFVMPTAYHGALGPIYDRANEIHLIPLRNVRRIALVKEPV